MVVSRERRLPWINRAVLFERNEQEPTSEKHEKESIVQQVEKLFSHVVAMSFDQDM